LNLTPCVLPMIPINLAIIGAGAHAGSRGRGFLLGAAYGAAMALVYGALGVIVILTAGTFGTINSSPWFNLAIAVIFVVLGLAMPWPIAGAGIASLPRPGRWMVHVKWGFGAVIITIAAYYAYESYSLFANRWVDPSAVTSSVQEQLKSGWYSSLGEGLAAAKREDKPVLIDMWATWCKNCLTMDKTTLADPSVRARLASY